MTLVPVRRKVDAPSPDASSLERVPWPTHMERLIWKPGEHTLALGPTGKGKSTLVRNLVKYREARKAHILIVATKSRNSFESLTPGPVVFAEQKAIKNHPRGYVLVKTWKRAKRLDHPRIILWVRYDGQGAVARQKREINRAFADVFSQGGWTVYIDEMRWFYERLKLQDWVTDMWTQGREAGISLVGSSQRPFFIGRDVYANSTHFYVWSTQDEDDLRRLSGIGGMETKSIRTAVAELQGYDVLYINARTKQMYVTRAPAPKGA